MTVSNGGNWTNSGELRIGYEGHGELNINGGTVSNAHAYIGYSTSGKANGVVNVTNGGTWTNSGELVVGRLSPGELNLHDGFVSASRVTVGETTLGTVNLSGGILAAGSVFSNVNGSIHFNGGTIRALKNESVFISKNGAAETTIEAGGAFIDSNGFNIGISSAFSGVGPLTKQGSGTLTLTGANTYSGATIVEKGTLRLDFSDPTAPNGNIVSPDSQLVLRGGTLEVIGKGGAFNSQHFIGFSVGTGASHINPVPGSPGDLYVNLGNFVSREIGGTLDISSYSGLNGFGNVPGGTTFGWLTGLNGAGFVGILPAPPSATWAPDNNTYIVGNVSPTANSTTNTVTFSQAADNTVTLNGTNTIATGGILVRASVGAHLSKFTGGSITSGNAEHDLIVHQWNTAGAFEIASAIVDNGGIATGLTKSGPGTLVLSGLNTYTGNTTINEGTLKINGDIYNDAVVNNGGVFGGNVVVHGSLFVLNGGTVAPGNSPGVFSVLGDITWNGGGTYAWEINDATGTAGDAAHGWDVQYATGALNIAATDLNPVVIDISTLTLGNVAGSMANFDPLLDRSWTIASAGGGIYGFNAGAFSLDTSHFANPTQGTFSVGVSGNNLNLLYAVTAVPEPSTWAMLVAGGAWLLFLKRRRS